LLTNVIYNYLQFSDNYSASQVIADYDDYTTVTTVDLTVAYDSLAL